MGFLDHSTNNIIIDAVLTDRGRELLAANDGTFTIARYAFGDDEVDYTIIKKFGRTIGKEKIEKNTPVFEAQTVASLALRHPIVSYSDPNLIALPTLSLDTTLAVVEQNKPLRVVMKQEIDSDKVTDRQRLLLQESMFQVAVDGRFLRLTGARSRARKEPFGFGLIYDVAARSGAGNVLSQIGFALAYVGTGSRFTQLQDSNGIVKTTVKVTGNSTGISETFEVSVKYTT
tara:strand:+ start:4228 stop:4917 length:690 start_codon:yes stop_codon:yes gene_type:complete